jgi:lantibiotic modifying enzyme
MPALKNVNCCWEPALSGRLAAEALKKALLVADRLSLIERVEQAAAEALRETTLPRGTHWIPYSMAQGYTGLALLWSYLDACRPGEHWDRVGREHLQLAARDAAGYSQLPIGLFSGLSGLAFATWQLSRSGSRYQRLLAEFDDVIAPRSLASARNIHRHHGMNVGEFDAISGLSGVGAYLLCRRNEPAISEALHVVIEALVELCLDDTPPFRWHTPCELVGDGRMAEVYPYGNLNLGLAHGIPGPLAFLALAHLAGSAAPGLTEAIAHAAGWISQQRFDDEWGVNWPTAVPLVSQHDNGSSTLVPASPTDAPDGPSRCAWCYGSPGIARSLLLAGEALDRDDLRELAVSAMQAVFRRPIAKRHINSPTFCHGVAGLLSVALRFRHDLGDGLFSGEISKLVEQILGHFQPDSLLGFRNMEIGDHEIEQPGLLDGAPGVALVLLAASTGVEPTWDRLFLLS